MVIKIKPICVNEGIMTINRVNHELGGRSGSSSTAMKIVKYQNKHVVTKNNGYGGNNIINKN